MSNKKRDITKYINIDQATFLKIVEVKKFKGAIDLVDPTLFNWVKGLANADKTLKKLIDNRLYVWCDYGTAIHDNPLMNISCKRAVAKRFKKLVKLGLLDSYYDKKDGNKTYFSISSFAYTYLEKDGNLDKYVPTIKAFSTFEGCILDYNPYVLSNTTPMYFRTQPLCTLEHNNSMLETVCEDSIKKNKTKKRTEDVELRREISEIKMSALKSSVVVDFTLPNSKVDKSTDYDIAYREYLKHFKNSNKSLKEEYVAYQQSRVGEEYVAPLHTWLGEYGFSSAKKATNSFNGIKEKQFEEGEF